MPPGTRYFASKLCSMDYARNVKPRNETLVSKKLLLLAGTLCLGLGILGMFFPILPTTPFLLLAAFCYARSSQRFYHWLITNRWFGGYIRNYRAGLGIPLSQKILTLALLWLSIAYAAWFVITPWWGKLVLVVIALGVTIHLLTMKTFKQPRMLPESLPSGEKNRRTPRMPRSVWCDENRIANQQGVNSLLIL